jgi:thymidylate kinase
MKQLLVAFSGMDGAGKSTQIENLRGFLAARGLDTRVLAFWDDVVVLSGYREGFVHRVFKSERGVGAPGKPVNRRDKNIRGWHVSLARHGLYLLDALNLRRVLSRARRCGADVVIMDRYIYDELANLPLHNPLSRAFVRVVAALSPVPDVAYVLDADPASARARKPEYPLEFLQGCRESYRRLAKMLGMAVIPPSSVELAARAVEQAFLGAWQSNSGAAQRKTDQVSDPELPIAG